MSATACHATISNMTATEAPDGTLRDNVLPPFHVASAPTPGTPAITATIVAGQRLTELPPAPTEPSELPAGPAVTPEEWRFAIVKHLRSTKAGTATVRETQAAVSDHFGHRFQADDLAPLPNRSTLRWHHHLSGAVRWLKDAGIVAESTKRGVWALTERGLTCDLQLIQRAGVLTRKPRIGVGQGIPMRELAVPVILALQAQRGTATTRDLISAVHVQVQHRLVPRDYELLTNGRPRWEQRCQIVKGVLRKAGLLSAFSPVGVWELTELGMAYSLGEHGGSIPAPPVERTPVAVAPAVPHPADEHTSSDQSPCRLTAAAVAVLDSRSDGRRLRRQNYVSSTAFKAPVIRYLQEQKGGAAFKWQIVNAVRERMWHRFQEQDLGRMKTRTDPLRWQQHLSFALLSLKSAGVLSNVDRGVWMLTSRGWSCTPDDYRTVVVDAGTTPKDFEWPIVSALLVNGGVTGIQQTYDAVHEQMKHRLLPQDYKAYKSDRTLRWKANVAQARQHLIRLGIVAAPAPEGPAKRGTWMLTDWALGRTTERPHTDTRLPAAEVQTPSPSAVKLEPVVEQPPSNTASAAPREQMKQQA